MLCRMARSEFEHEFEIAAPRARLHAFLCDLHNLRALHPLIVSIEDLPRDAARPGARRHRILDRVALGPLRLPARYVAEIEPVADDTLRAEAWQWPGVHLETTYRLHVHVDEGGDATRLVEHVRVEAPRWLLRFVTRQASEAHRETLSRMQAHFARGRT